MTYAEIEQIGSLRAKIDRWNAQIEDLIARRDAAQGKLDNLERENKLGPEHLERLMRRYTRRLEKLQKIMDSEGIE